MASAFTYQILQVDEIRILEMIPDDSEVISCQLQHFSFPERPRFSALSYCWEQQKTSEQSD